MAFTVLMATGNTTVGAYSLTGKYYGAKASATLGGGAGVSVLVGGGDDSVTLQPLAVEGRAVMARIRNTAAAVPGRLIPAGNGMATMLFTAPEFGVSPGQACVFYDDDRVLGGGWIQRELSGEGDARRSNAQFKYLIQQGQSGIDLIGDSPTQSLMDPDHPLAKHVIGTQGVSLCCHNDYRDLLARAGNVHATHDPHNLAYVCGRVGYQQGVDTRIRRDHGRLGQQGRDQVPQLADLCVFHRDQLRDDGVGALHRRHGRRDCLAILPRSVVDRSQRTPGTAAEHGRPGRGPGRRELRYRVRRTFGSRVDSRHTRRNADLEQTRKPFRLRS